MRVIYGFGTCAATDITADPIGWGIQTSFVLHSPLLFSSRGVDSLAFELSFGNAHRDFGCPCVDPFTWAYPFPSGSGSFGFAHRSDVSCCCILTTVASLGIAGDAQFLKNLSHFSRHHDGSKHMAEAAPDHFCSCRINFCDLGSYPMERATAPRATGGNVDAGKLFRSE